MYLQVQTLKSFCIQKHKQLYNSTASFKDYKFYTQCIHNKQYIVKSRGKNKEKGCKVYNQAIHFGQLYTNHDETIGKQEL